MKEYKVEVIGVTLKTKKSLKEAFQKLLDEYTQNGYTLHSFDANIDIFTAVFEREIKNN